MGCFALYSASRAITGLYRPVLDELGLTYPQFLALTVVWHRGSVTVGELGAALHLDSGTLSPLLKRLEAQGLIHRDRGTADERTVWVTSTAKGGELRPHVQDLPERLAGAINLSRAEFDQLLHLVNRIHSTAAL
jgi:DNA-binding MarR family transcriptional regulator